MAIQTDDTSYGMLRDEIVRVTTEDRFLSTKSQIVEHYRGTYTGRGSDGWRQHLVNDLASLTGMKPKSLERRFDPSRLGNEEKKNTGQYEALGKQLPPVKVPKDIAGRGANVHFQGTLWFSAKAYYKDFGATLDPDELAEMIENNAFDAIIDAYGIDSLNVEDVQLDKLSIELN
jgi:hypothetical protein